MNEQQGYIGLTSSHSLSTVIDYFIKYELPPFDRKHHFGNTGGDLCRAVADPKKFNP